MNPMQQRLIDFHQKAQGVGAKAGIGTVPTIPTNQELRADLIMEEAEELSTAILDGNLIEMIDGASDLLVVVFGTMVEAGVDIQPFFDHIMDTNDAKTEASVCVVREDGKLLKPDGWEPPDIQGLLQSGVGVLHP